MILRKILGKVLILVNWTYKEYLKQLHLQKYYLQKFSINYASTWLKEDIKNMITAIDKEIDFYNQEILKYRIKHQQLSLFEGLR